MGVTMKNLATPQIWLVCGSQHLYGPGPLAEVESHARRGRPNLERVRGGDARAPLQGPPDHA